MASKGRLVAAAILAGAVFGVLTFRVADLQLASGDDFYALSQQNRLRRIPVRAPRGRIYDRNGDILAGNKPSYALLWMLPSAEAVPVAALERSAGYLATTPAALAATIEENREFPYEPAEVSSGLTSGELFAFEEVRARYPEMTVVSRPQRY